MIIFKTGLGFRAGPRCFFVLIPLLSKENILDMI